MKTLCIQYTPDKIYLSIATETTISQTESFSSKEIRTTITRLQHLLSVTGLSLESIHNICVNIGPAPAFTQRSLFATLNGIVMTLRLQNVHPNLFAIDDFELIHEIEQQKNQNDFVIVLANAYANDLFFLYYEEYYLKSGVIPFETCLQQLNQFQKEHTVHIIGTITNDQEAAFTNHSFRVTNNISIVHTDYCAAAIAKTKIQKPVDYLLPRYTKLHVAELKNK